MARKTAGIHDNKVQFVNNLDGIIGVVTYAPNGDEKSIAVGPGETVWLSDAEQELTAKAPASAKDNPFVEQKMPVYDHETGKVVSYKRITPLTVNDEERPIGRSSAKADAPDGTHGATEEIGTPEAQKPPAKRRRRAAASTT